VATLNASGIAFACDRVPDRCPLCHFGISPLYVGGVAVRYVHLDSATIDVVFQCPRDACKRAFIATYDGGFHPTTSEIYLYLESTAPFEPMTPVQPTEVAAISPQFVEIFRQAAAAEGMKLKDVAGCGYRKALEFLIKDYCVARNPGRRDAIERSFLGKVIDDDVDDENIKDCAQRATWLGNDETHYVRVWAEKDITNLKELLALTVSWVNTRLLTDRLKASMPPKGKKP
jgi:hypothetical protein